MNCDQALRAVSAAADGELDDAVLAQLDEHLAGCAECRAFDRGISRVRSQLRFEPIAGPPGTGGLPDLVPTLRARLAALSSRGDGGRKDELEAMVVGGRSRSPRARSSDHHRLGVAEDTRLADAADPDDDAANDDAANMAPRTGAWAQVRRVRVAAVAAAVGMIAGATFAGLGRDPQPPAGADLAEQVLTAQRGITTLEARFQLTEGDERSFDGVLVYDAPESLVLELTETTPSGGTRPVVPAEPADGDVRLEVDEDRWRLDAARRCASCPTSVTTWHRLVTGREPFSDAAPVPLELVTAVDSFAMSGELPQLGGRTVAGRDAVGVRVPAAQIAAFLAALSPAGDLRPVHPTDPVDVWLEREHLVPLLVEVRAGDSPGRDQWAASQGYIDSAGATLLRYEVEAMSVNGDALGELGGDDTGAGTAAAPVAEPLPAGAETEERDDGFRAGDAAFVPEPSVLPDGLRPYLSGTVDTADGPLVGVRSWTDGRAWLKVRATDEWTGPRLFGSAATGPNLRTVDLGEAGVAYQSADARTVALHADGLDLLVTGSLPAEQLRAVAASLGVVGLAVPAEWPEAATATVADARAVLPQVLVVRGLDGFGAPAIRVEPNAVTQVYAGPGDRGFVFTQSPFHKLSPPSDPDSMAVTVRGVAGRYSVGRGELEWATADGSYSLASPTLSMSELVAVADHLEPA